MELQDLMFAEVSAWYDSSLPKLDFLKGKEYTLAKFNYWLSRWKFHQSSSEGSDFKELNFEDSKAVKVLEIEVPSGIRIRIFA